MKNKNKKEKYRMSLFAKARSGNMKEAFKNEAGAIDLASIMVGIIVIGLIGGVIAATVFAVIPWAQDNAAKQQLDSVASAQAAYIGLSADKGDSHFGGNPVTINITIVSGVTTTNYVYAKSALVGGEPSGPSAVTEKLFDGGSGNIAVGSWGVGNVAGGAHYAAATKSSSGKTFYISDAKTQPTALTQAQQDSAKATNEVEAIAYSVK